MGRGLRLGSRQRRWWCMSFNAVGYVRSERMWCCMSFNAVGNVRSERMVLGVIDGSSEWLLSDWFFE